MRSANAIAAMVGRVGWVCALALSFCLLVSQTALAQTPGGNSLFSTAPTTGLISPGPVTRGNVFGPGGVLEPPAQTPITPNGAQMPMVPAGQVALSLSARFGRQAPPIGGGLTWRVFAAKADAAGNFSLVKED